MLMSGLSRLAFLAAVVSCKTSISTVALKSVFVQQISKEAFELWFLVGVSLSFVKFLAADRS